MGSANPSPEPGNYKSMFRFRILEMKTISPEPLRF